MKVLALCGSLRRESRSRALLQAFELLAPARMEFAICPHVGRLPLFNPDDEIDAPAVVRQFWESACAADALVIASPEYAHGVTGVIKNALDWLVGREAFPNKPVALLNPSHRAEHADAALREILVTMNTRLIDDACLRIPATACALDAAGLVRTELYATGIRAALAAIAAFHDRARQP